MLLVWPWLRLLLLSGALLPADLENLRGSCTEEARLGEGVARRVLTPLAGRFDGRTVSKCGGQYFIIKTPSN